MDFKELEGKYVSILITGKNGKRDTYFGKVDEVSHGFLVLRLKDIEPSESVPYPIERIFFKLSAIESMYVFKKKD